jgi:hypothetical protein
MEIRFLTAQAAFGFVFGLVVAHWFGLPWWGTALAAPVMSAAAYVTSRWRLKRLDLKPDILFLDYIEARRKRWRDGR